MRERWVPSYLLWFLLLPLRTFQTVEALTSFMADDDWASQFRPESEQTPQEMIEELFEEPSIELEIGEEAQVNLLREGPEAQLVDILSNQQRIMEVVDTMQSKLSLLESAVTNPPWLSDLNSNLQAVLRDNAAAIVGANNQFMAIISRKMDEMEERMSSDEPSYTNILYSNPELFNEISQRPDENELSTEEEFVAKQKVADIVHEENPELLTEQSKAAEEEAPVDIAYKAWRNKEIKWHEFVKAAGGVKAASEYKNMRNP
jgi:hypothetical protein